MEAASGPHVCLCLCSGLKGEQAHFLSGGWGREGERAVGWGLRGAEEPANRFPNAFES